MTSLLSQPTSDLHSRLQATQLTNPHSYFQSSYSFSGKPKSLSRRSFFEDFLHSILQGVITRFRRKLLHPWAVFELRAFSAILNPLLFTTYSDLAVLTLRIASWKPTATKTSLSVHQPIVSTNHKTFVSLATRAISTTKPNKPFWRTNFLWQRLFSLLRLS